MQHARKRSCRLSECGNSQSGRSSKDASFFVAMAESAFAAAVDEWSDLSLPKTDFALSAKTKDTSKCFSELPLITFNEAFSELQPCVDVDQATAAPVNRLISLRYNVPSKVLAQGLPCVFAYPLPPPLLLEERRLIGLSKVPFDDTEIGQRMLRSIYNQLRPGDNRVERKGAHWENIGFQGADPATDLRGVGMLGLLQLLWFVSNSRLATFVKEMYCLSQDKTQNFPFAILTINMARSSLQVLKSRKLRKFCDRNNSVIETFNLLYLGALHKFHLEWSGGGKTIADAGFVIKDVEHYITTNVKRCLRTAERVLQGDPPQPTGTDLVTFSAI